MPRSERNHRDPFRLLRPAVVAAVAASIAVLAAGAPALAQTSSQPPEPAKDKIPRLASVQFAWLVVGVDWLDPPRGLGRGPIRQDPAYPFHGNRDGPGQVTPHIGNARDPVLKPWAAKQMQASNEEVLNGKRGLPFSAQSSCYPGGVPEQLLTPAEPLYFVQTPQEVWMIWQTDHMVRRIFMTAQHAETVKPSWFGESIGRYEDGDTLVVDTVGLQAKNSYLDWFRIARSCMSSSASSYRPTARRWTPWSRSRTPTPSTRRCTWRAAGARCRTRCSRWSAPRTTAIISARTCSRSHMPTWRISRMRD
jgi:hypothetical protein